MRSGMWLRHPAYSFELVKQLPDEAPDMYGKREGAQYQLLHDKGIATLLTMKIRLIEFRGLEPGWTLSALRPY